MSPSDKNKATANSETSDENQSDKMDTSHTSELASSSTSDLILPCHGTITNIPLFTADLPTLKCSINDQMKTFDPGEVMNKERLNNQCGSSLMFPVKNSPIKNSNNKNYKAGSKINKLADMLAKRSQNVVEVTQNVTSDIISDITKTKPPEGEEGGGGGGTGQTESGFGTEGEGEAGEENRCGEDEEEELAVVVVENKVENVEKTVNDKPVVELVKKSRRKSVPNESSKNQELVLQSNTSKSCCDFTELFPENSKLNALDEPMIQPQTDESTKKKVIKKNLKNIELSLILPEKKRRSSPRCKKPDDTAKTDKSEPPVSVKVVKKLRKSQRLVETSTQTADVEINSLAKSDDKQLFICLYCTEGFASPSLCKIHEKTHTPKDKNKQSIKCQYCSKKLPSLNELKSHCRKSHVNKYFYCAKCDERFLDRPQLVSHNKIHLPKAPEEETTATEEKKEKNAKQNGAKADLKIDVSFETVKKSSTSPRNVQKVSPRENKTEEQLLEMEMLFYSHLSGNIQENLTNHLDGKIDKNGNPVRTDQILDPADPNRSSNVLSVVVPNAGIPIAQISRAPSPYQTRSKTPNPLPKTAKKFKKLPNWQQKFWEKYNFPTNYRYEHRFWDKNYLNTEKSALYLKDLSCLDIKTQLTMRENIKKLDEVKASEDVAKIPDKCNFPDFLSLVPRLNNPNEEQRKEITNRIPEVAKLKPLSSKKEELSGKKSFKSPSGVVESSVKTRRMLNLDLKKKVPEEGKVMTRRQSIVEMGREEKEVESRRRKGSLDMTVEQQQQKMVLRRQTSLDNIQGSSKGEEEKADDSNSVSSLSSEPSNRTLYSDVAEISGEWVRPRSYLCGTCCSKFNNLWELEDHKWAIHPNVWCTHYEFEDEKIDKLFKKTEEEVISDKPSSSTASCSSSSTSTAATITTAATAVAAAATSYSLPDLTAKLKLTDLYKRYLLPHGSLKTAKLVPQSNFPEQCTKCRKNCSNSSDMHKHMLDCGGDTTWFLTMYSSPTTMKRRWRPFGSRRRKQIGRRMVKRNIPSTPTLRPYQYQHRVRTKPGDVETIQKMLANLPEKRARRAINFDEIKTRSQATIHSNRLLRKRFQVSFGSNYMRLKNLKSAQQRQLKQVKKESSSKSTTDTSSESTPIGSPKRRSRHANSPLIKIESPEESQAEATSEAGKKVPAKKNAEKKKPAKKTDRKKSKAAAPASKKREISKEVKIEVEQLDVKIESRVDNNKKKPKESTKKKAKFGKTSAPAAATTPDTVVAATNASTATAALPKGEANVAEDLINVDGKKQLPKNNQIKKKKIMRLKKNNKDKTELIKRIKNSLRNSKRVLEMRINDRRRSQRIQNLQDDEVLLPLEEGIPDGKKSPKNGKSPEDSEVIPKQDKPTPKISRKSGNGEKNRKAVKIEPEEGNKPTTDLSGMPILDKEEPIKGRTTRKSETDIPVLMPYENGDVEKSKKKDLIRFKIVKKGKTGKIVKDNGDVKRKRPSVEGSENEENGGKEAKKARKYFLGICPNEIDKGRAEEARDESGSDNEPLISLVNADAEAKIVLPQKAASTSSADRVERLEKKTKKKRSDSKKSTRKLRMTVTLKEATLKVVDKTPCVPCESKWMVKEDASKETDKEKGKVSETETEKLGEQKVEDNVNERLQQEEKEERDRQVEIEKEKTRLKKIEIEKEQERLRQIEKELEEERLKEMEKEKERQKQIEKEKEIELQKEIEKEKELQRLKQIEKERLREEKEKEKERLRKEKEEREKEKERLRKEKEEREKERQKEEEKEKERQRKEKEEKEKERQKKEREESEREKDRLKQEEQEKELIKREKEKEATSLKVKVKLKEKAKEEKTVLQEENKVERRSRRISKETKASNEFVIDDPLLLVDELWSELDSDDDSSKKRKTRKKKKQHEERKSTDVNLEELLRNFGEKKEVEVKLPREKVKVKYTEVRSKLEETMKKTKSKSYKRLSLRLFKFCKKKQNFGNSGKRLTEKELKEVKISLPEILSAEVKENPVQIIQCRTPKVKKCAKKVESNIQLKVSLPLESINNLAILNNNHLTDLVVEQPTLREEEPLPPETDNEIKDAVETEQIPVLAPTEEKTEASAPVLENKSRRSEVIDKIFYCEICQTYYYSSSQLKNHKLSNRHKAKESELAHAAAVEQNKPSEEATTLVEEKATEPAPVVAEEERLNDDTMEMPTLEGPFIENPFVRLGMERIEPKPAPPPPPPPPTNSFGFSEDCLKDIQRAIGCTDEEMLILTLLGENSIEIENDILDLDSCQPVRANHSDASEKREEVAREADKPNGSLKIDLKKRMTSALACLVNKAVFNFLHKSENAAKAPVNPEALSFLNKLSSMSRRRNIFQLNELLKKQNFGESSMGGLFNTEEKKFQRVPYKYQCTICGSRFEKASTRECHIIRTHRLKGKKLDGQQQQQQSKQDESQAAQSTYEDEQPDWNDTWSYDANDDILPAGNASQFWCSDCGINFTSPQEVLDHQKAEHQATKEPEPAIETAGPLQSSTIGSSDEIVEGKKSVRKRAKHFSYAELDQQRIIANNELRKLDRKFANKTKTNKTKWGMDALKFTLEKENKPGEKVVVPSEDAQKPSPVDPKNIDLIPKLNLSRTNNIPEFKVVQKNSFENRFQKIIDNKMKRKSTRTENEADVGDDEEDEDEDDEDEDEEEEETVLMADKKKKPKSTPMKKDEEQKTFDVYDFNESESETEPIVLSHVKKPVGSAKSKSGKVETAKNKPDSTTQDIAPDDYDSEDSLPLAVVKKTNQTEDDEEDNVEKSDKILEQVEYLIEQLENDTKNEDGDGEQEADATKKAKKKKQQGKKRVVEEEKGTSVDPVPESFRVSLENKFLQLDNIRPRKEKNVSDDEDSMPLVMMKKPEETSKESDLSSLTCDDAFKQKEEVSEESLPPLLTDERDKTDKCFETLNGNVIYRRNDSVSDFESELSDLFEKTNDSDQSFIKEVMENEDVVIVCSKKEEEEEEKEPPLEDEEDEEETEEKVQTGKRKRASPKTTEKKKKILPLLSATIEEDSFRKSESPKLNKEVIVKRIWSRKKMTEDSTDCEESPMANNDEDTEIEKEMIMKRIWSRKKVEESQDSATAGKKKVVDDGKINQTEVSDEIVIKCGPKTKPATKRRKKSVTNDSPKDTIMRRIWSGKCTFQTKAALKTYESDIVPAGGATTAAATAVAAAAAAPKEAGELPKRRGRPPTGQAAQKRAKIEIDGEKSDEDDLDSLLEEIEREDLEKAIRLEFLLSRRSDKADNVKDAATVGLFTETCQTQNKEVVEKRRRKIRKNINKHPRKTLLNRRRLVKKTVRKLRMADDAATPENPRLATPVDSSEASSQDKKNGFESMETKMKIRKHKKHRHKHHHHKHKHKKSKHHKSIVGKHKNKHSKFENETAAAAAADATAAEAASNEESESFSILEKMCQRMRKTENEEDEEEEEQDGGEEEEAARSVKKSKLATDLDNLDSKLDEILMSPFSFEQHLSSGRKTDEGRTEKRTEGVYEFVDDDEYYFGLDKKKNYKK